MKKIWNLWFEQGIAEDGTWLILQMDPETRKPIRTVGSADVSIVNNDKIVIRLKMGDSPPLVEADVDDQGRKIRRPPWSISSLRSLVSTLVIYDYPFYDEVRGKTFALVRHEDMDGNVVREFKDTTFK